MYDISGSAHFVNKTDNAIIVHRIRDPDGDPMKNRQVQIKVAKVRNKAAGTIGDAVLLYDVLTGRYEDVTGGNIPLPNAKWSTAETGQRGGRGAAMQSAVGMAMEQRFEASLAPAYALDRCHTSACT